MQSVTCSNVFLTISLRLLQVIVLHELCKTVFNKCASRFSTTCCNWHNWHMPRSNAFGWMRCDRVWILAECLLKAMFIEHVCFCQHYHREWHLVTLASLKRPIHLGHPCVWMSGEDVTATLQGWADTQNFAHGESRSWAKSRLAWSALFVAIQACIVHKAESYHCSWLHDIILARES